MKNYTIDHASTSIVCTKKFYESASQFGSDECDLLQEVIAAFPTYSVKVRAIKINENKRTANKNLTYANMVRYIASQPNARENLVEFAKKRNLANQKGHGYDMVRNWFKSKYSSFMQPVFCEQEEQEVEWFISMATARKLLAEFAECQTLEEVVDVIDTIFGDMEKKDSTENPIALLDKVS
ncbi:MAG: hypothetical protein HDT38_02385 [Clostridiales bacterium]|nr:hypothetical protein [Clostridiales bacterium]